MILNKPSGDEIKVSKFLLLGSTFSSLFEIII